MVLYGFFEMGVLFLRFVILIVGEEDVVMIGVVENLFKCFVKK